MYDFYQWFFPLAKRLRRWKVSRNSEPLAIGGHAYKHLQLPLSNYVNASHTIYQH